MHLRRGRRPVAACVLVAAAAVELGYFPLARIGLLPVEGTSAALVMMFSLTLIGCAVHMWVSPARAPYSGAAAVALGLLSYPFANLGGFLLGMLLALTGGSLGLAWQPAPDPAPGPAPGTDPVPGADSSPGSGR